MFDIGFIELVVIGVVGLLVIGPQRLPHAARVVMLWINKIRATVTEFKTEVEREVRAQELKESLQKSMDEAGISQIQEEVRRIKGSVDQEINAHKRDMLTDSSSEEEASSSNAETETENHELPATEKKRRRYEDDHKDDPDYPEDETEYQSVQADHATKSQSPPSNQQ